MCAKTPGAKANEASQPSQPATFADRPRECELRPLRLLIALLISGTRESTPPNPASSEVDLLRSAIRRYVHEIVHDRLFTRARDTQKMATIIIHQRCCPMKRDCAHVQKEAITAAPLALLPWPTKQHQQKKRTSTRTHTHNIISITNSPLCTCTNTHTHKTVHSTMVNVVFVCVLVCFFPVHLFTTVVQHLQHTAIFGGACVRVHAIELSARVCALRGQPHHHRRRRRRHRQHRQHQQQQQQRAHVTIFI